MGNRAIADLLILSVDKKASMKSIVVFLNQQSAIQKSTLSAVYETSISGADPVAMTGSFAADTIVAGVNDCSAIGSTIFCR